MPNGYTIHVWSLRRAIAATYDPPVTYCPGCSLSPLLLTRRILIQNFHLQTLRILALSTAILLGTPYASDVVSKHESWSSRFHLHKTNQRLRSGVTAKSRMQSRGMRTQYLMLSSCRASTSNVHHWHTCRAVAEHPQPLFW